MSDRIPGCRRQAQCAPWWPQLAELRINGRNGCGLRRAEKNKGPRKALQAVLLCGMFLIGRREGAAIGAVLAKLSERNVVESGRLGKLASRDRQQQRLHGEGIDRNRANQPSPE
jgi:hypothetical protein